ncbi:hypothetical protein QN277_004926 [Acacia crassicarpa]|uniref:BOI-related E3 ubiquitin-protein ligase 3 n=1 Tax=Acacia crassicarpa TaxID=499986 RepID=A0AAE1IW14_9FABA|nr:hypothetical protein QN277_004926 [Acacia crassicarpa]
MAIQVGFPQISQDLIALNACDVPDFPHPSFYHLQIQPQHYFSVTQTHPNMLHTNFPVSASKLNIPSLVPNFEKHDHEIDHYIKLQCEKLSMKLQEQRKQQMATVLNAVKFNMLNLMSQKDEDIAHAAKKRMELENLLNRVEAENQAWRRAASEGEAMILSLNNSLEEMKDKAECGFNNVWADEAESCWDESEEDYRQMDDDEQRKREMASCACRSCKYGRSCVLFLPCRHLCVCKACEPFLQACPVCKMPKKATIEALIF